MSRVRDFGAAGNGEADDTEALAHVLRSGDGVLVLSRGTYRITRTLEIDLQRFNRIGIDGSQGTATVVMEGPGPAFRFVGTHGGSAAPDTFKPEVWDRQRMPQISNLEIRGAHPEADGIEVTGTMEATFSGVLLRQLRHGIRLVKRNRNVLITGCHIFHNTGAGIFCEDLNLHQFNITGNHISYNRLGGIRIERSEIRNLQITGNDIEYNNFKIFGKDRFDPTEPTAEIYFDCRERTEGVPSPSIREFTIASNTIQATHSPNGCNIRIIGPDPTGVLPIGMGTISGNLIGNQAINLHLTACRGISITGNHIYGGYRHNVRMEGCDDMALTGNVFGHNYWVPGKQIDNNLFLEACSDCVLQGLQVRGAPEGRTTWTEDWAGGAARLHEALIEMNDCRRMVVNGCLFRDPCPVGIQAVDCSQVTLTGCQLHDTREKSLTRAAVVWKGTGTGNLMASNRFDAPVEREAGCEVEGI
ncbi:MAG: Right handed beta helix region [Verrucomicrobia bacterium]|jgi:uncharacterized protein YjbI with pentapeptide repeats|nr:MAG: Right handed beta helix region [Verrucomicrobiota bacterium]